MSSKRLQVRYTPAEYERLERAAERQGLTVSAFVRYHLRPIINQIEPPSDGPVKRRGKR